MRNTDGMDQDQAEPVEAPHADQVDAKGQRNREVLTTSNFILLAAAVLTLVIAALVAIFTTLNTWTIFLVALGVLLALAVTFTRLTQMAWFYPTVSWLMIAALIAGGIYIAVKEKHTQASARSQAAGTTATPPGLHFFASQSPQPVPWCGTFFITTTGPVPSGYEIVVFDASTDYQYNVTSSYYYDGAATPVNGTPDEWKLFPVYIGSRYKQNSQGKNIFVNGKPVSNAGYPVAVFAELVPDTEAQLLHSVTAYNDEWGLGQLPSEPLASARLDTVRSGNASQCA
jgi:hypothetical protein